MVNEKRPEIVWDIEAKIQLQAIIKEIKQDSIQGAEIVRNVILNSIGKIPDNPYRYPPDKFKSKNIGNYRSFEIYNYRITYKVMEYQILILRIRHSKREPLDY